MLLITWLCILKQPTLILYNTLCNDDPLARSGTATTWPAFEGTPCNANRISVGATTPAQRTLAARYIGNCYGLAIS